MSSGYQSWRAAPHEHAMRVLIAEMERRGEPIVELPVDGHRPDARFVRFGDYLELKTGGPNLAVEVESLRTYQRIEAEEGRRVFVVWIPCTDARPADRVPFPEWVLATPAVLAAGIISGPLEHSGSGSNDPWYLINPKGVPWDRFFPDPVVVSASSMRPPSNQLTLGAV